MKRGLFALILFLAGVTLANANGLGTEGMAGADGRAISDLGRIHAAQNSVLNSLRAQDAMRESNSGNARGGVSGGTHILAGCALMTVGLWLGMTLDSKSEENLGTTLITILAPVALVGGSVELIYGIVRVATSKNDFD